MKWAKQHNKRCAFTLSNAGANYFESRCKLEELQEINWDAVQATKWSGAGISTLIKEGKQAEFLVEEQFPWELVERVGALSQSVAEQAMRTMQGAAHRPRVEITPDWYY